MPLSLQCPRCNGAVSVADQAAGLRVKCPHCDQTFLAPGITVSPKDDDDWLSLDELPKSAPVPGAAPSSRPTSSLPTSGAVPPRAKPRARPLSAADEALLAEFTSDMDKFTAEIEPLPVPQPMTPPAAIAQPSGIPAFRGPPAKPGSPAAKPAKTGPAPKPASDVVEYAKEYRVNCHICGSLMYVKAAQAGKTIKCSDCHSAMTVPGPPRIKKSLQIDLDQAETFALEESRTAQRGPDPYQKSAQQLLDEAARVEQINPQPTYDDTPSVKEWFANVFGIFKDLGAVAHWIGLSVLASVPAVMAIQMDNPALIMALFPGGFFLGVLTVSCGFAILHSVANQLGSVEDWPTLNPLAWLGKLMLVVIAACLVAVPMWAICMFTVGPSLIGAAVTMMAIYVGFPFVLLSMLDMNSALVPFSPEVARSVTKCEEAWGGFYFSSGLLFVTLFLIFAAASGWNPVLGAVVPIASGIGATFIYFAMIGRLAYAIGQSIHAPPRKTDVAAGG